MFLNNWILPNLPELRKVMPKGNLRHSAYGWFHNMMPLMYLYCQVALYAKINFWWIESLLCIIPIIIWSLSIVDESNKFTNDVFLSIYNTNMHIYNCTSTFFQVFATLSTSSFSFISTCIRTYTTSFLRLELYIMHLCTHTQHAYISCQRNDCHCHWQRRFA